MTDPTSLDWLVVYYSRTGTTAALADRVCASLEDPDCRRIRPRGERSYPNWLLRSFVPGSTVPIEDPTVDPAAYDAVLLGTPKWTFSCPPVTEFLRRVAFDGVPTGVFLTYGGFDERRYARSLRTRLRRRGATVAGTLLVKRGRVADAACQSGVQQFCEAVRGRAVES